MKIGIAQLNYHVGNIDENIRKISDAACSLFIAGADIVVFSELAICGYPPQDILEEENFVAECVLALHKLQKKIPEGKMLIIGTPWPNNGPGKHWFNAVASISDKKTEVVHVKNLLPDYDVFDECRYFEPGHEAGHLLWHEKKIVLSVCEDLWEDKISLYSSSFQKKIARHHPEIIINLSASPFHAGHFEQRKQVMQNTARQHQSYLIHVNQTGANTDLVFDGRSLVIAPDGKIIYEGKAFEEDLAVTEIPCSSPPQQEKKTGAENLSLIRQALVTGICDFFKKNHFQKAILGLSGGIDSALTYVLACEALGTGNVLALLLPSPFSSSHSIEDAIALVKNTKGHYEIVNIKEIYSLISQQLSKQWGDTSFGITQENLQARLRGMILMAYANRFGYVLLNTTNKSEMAVGYGTLYGDMCGALSVLGDVYKTTVYELAHFINHSNNIIPSRILEKAPSAELRPNQKDSDTLPEYPILDTILTLYLEEKKGADSIVKITGFSKEIVSKVIEMVKKAEFKRYQAPPVIRITSKAFGYGRKFPLVAKF